MGRRVTAVAAATVSAAAVMTVAGCGSSSNGSTPEQAVSHASNVPTVGPIHPSATPQPKPAVISLTIVKEAGEALVIAPVTIKGKEYPFVVDTGATVTLVNDHLAKELGVTPNGKTLPITGIGGGRQAKLANVSGWAIGKSKLPTSTVGIAVNTFSPTTKIAGLLGSDVLSTFGKVTIDYKNQKASLG
jgi:predicted aspartyl protease